MNLFSSPTQIHKYKLFFFDAIGHNMAIGIICKTQLGFWNLVKAKPFEFQKMQRLAYE